MIEVNATIVLQVINFLLLVYLLNRFLIKPVMAVIHSRKEYVEKKYKQVEKLEQSRQEGLSKYQTEISMARDQANKKREELKKVARKKEKPIIEKARAEGEKIIEKIQVELSLETEKVREELQHQVNDIALIVTEKILGRKA